ncbi:protein of unknown function [Alicyclobacillus macrosporangiidus]|uniref:Uncharacterized protein n=2 Tax=Alicyclobacillus macrosporangiidus TaxID=392015 RepID=A0A1I7KWB9_9BACL|nr:protein of unknown function [Alicyclobacillus macrosporangiidus]
MAFLTAVESGVQPHMIRCGILCSPSAPRCRRWRVDQLLPCLAFVQSGKVLDQCFEGVLFEADLSCRGEMISPRSMGFGQPPTARTWLDVVEELFRPEQNVPALLQTSQRLPAGRQVDLWIALPYPFENQPGFGTVRGKRLNFQSNPEHRTEAVVWWMEQVCRRWQRTSRRVPSHRVVFRGFAWTRSMLWPADHGVIREVAEWVHRNQLKLMWCYHDRTEGADSAGELGFDLCLNRPLLARGIHRIDAAAAFAEQHGHGVILAWDGARCPDSLTEVLQAVRNRIREAVQLLELPFGVVGQWCQQAEPAYRALYQYIRGIEAQNGDSKGGART